MPGSVSRQSSWRSREIAGGFLPQSVSVEIREIQMAPTTVGPCQAVCAPSRCVLSFRFDLMARVESVFAVGCLVSKAQPTKASLRERSIDGVSYLVSHPVDLNKEFAVGHDSSGKPGSSDGRVYRSLNREFLVTAGNSLTNLLED